MGGIFQVGTFMADVPKVTVPAVNLFFGLLDGDVVFFGIIALWTVYSIGTELKPPTKEDILLFVALNLLVGSIIWAILGQILKFFHFLFWRSGLVLPRKVTVICPNCNNAFEVKVWGTPIYIH